MEDIWSLLESYLPIVLGAIITALIAFLTFVFNVFQTNRRVSFVPLHTARQSALSSLSRVSIRFREYSSVIQNPISLLFPKFSNRKALATLYGPVIFMFLVLGAEFEYYKNIVDPLSGLTFQLELGIFLVAFFNLLSTDRGGPRSIWRNVDLQAPRKIWLVPYALFDASDLILMVLVMAAGACTILFAVLSYEGRGPEKFSSLYSYPTLPTIVGFVIVIVVELFIFRVFRQSITRKIENYAFTSYFNDEPLIIEVTLGSIGGEQEPKVRGRIVSIESTLIVDRDDEFREEIPWSVIRRIASKSSGLAKVDSKTPPQEA